MEGYTLVGEDGFFFVLGGELADGVALLVGGGVVLFFVAFPVAFLAEKTGVVAEFGGLGFFGVGRFVDGGVAGGSP